VNKTFLLNKSKGNNKIPREDVLHKETEIEIQNETYADLVLRIKQVVTVIDPE
jgi:hypothetical protein